MTGSTYAKELGARLRAIRQQQGLSLQGVETKSHGLWKAVVVGSYERGDRAVTVARLAELAEFYGVPLAELAEFYGVPLAELLPDSGGRRGSEARGRLVIDLVRLKSVDDPEAAPLARFTASIQAQRGDYNGKVLTIRSEDLRALAVIYDQAPRRAGRADGRMGRVGPGGPSRRRLSGFRSIPRCPAASSESGST